MITLFIFLALTYAFKVAVPGSSTRTIRIYRESERHGSMSFHFVTVLIPLFHRGCSGPRLAIWPSFTMTIWNEFWELGTEP